MTGVIKNLRIERGFGFITAEDGKDYFFHRSALAGDEFDELITGDQVDIGSSVSTPKGPRADTVRRLNPAPIEAV